MKVGAVNTVRVDRKDDEITLSGYNTDVDGFRDSLVRIIRPGVKKALILGTGGASKAVAYVLTELKIDFEFVSRQKKENRLSYKELSSEIIKSRLLIINTSPLGTFPEINTFPNIPYEPLSPSHILFDLVYNPPETVFLREGKEERSSDKKRVGYACTVRRSRRGRFGTILKNFQHCLVRRGIDTLWKYNMTAMP
jgi:shikimate dehydrogenase